MTFARNFAPVVYQEVILGTQSIPDMVAKLYNVQATQSKKQYRLGIGGTQIEVWDEYNQTGQSGHGDIDRGYATTFEADPFTRRITLLKSDLKEPGGIDVYQTALREIGVSAMRKRQVDGAKTFINAFSASFVGADGVALCSASHPQGPDDTGTTYDNTGTEALSYTAILNARDNLRNLVDQQGGPLYVNGTYILAPIELLRTLQEIIPATNKPGGADNDSNAIQGFQYDVWDELTNAKDWWLIDPVRMKQHLLWFDRSPLSMMVVDENTTDITYEFHMEYVLGWVDPRWVYGNDVA
jgi:hypothetical protein